MVVIGLNDLANKYRNRETENICYVYIKPLTEFWLGTKKFLKPKTKTEKIIKLPKPKTV